MKVKQLERINDTLSGLVDSLGINIVDDDLDDLVHLVVEYLSDIQGKKDI